MRRLACQAKKLLASQEGIYAMNLVTISLEFPNAVIYYSCTLFPTTAVYSFMVVKFSFFRKRILKHRHVLSE